MKLVQVLKSAKRTDTYIYVAQGHDLETLPEALTAGLGELSPVLSMRLTPDRTLARFSGAQVLAAIEEQGFFLQIPPPLEDDERC
ncbi:conserved hypothetical protein [Luminiphilus syltensis NOR5-1B]|uniref:YcgL domain-containing protein n=1 Tax=Luminiphilus syltensis NOR5-1B TaxID=565045 RepID=B8KYG6_9GAMM|nr:YcgL domain-containing protein [Luminiphilus syltensis]EED35057.1 conserved hypothetical protein [Luminiphilus syltensis NOR5-1B]